jgi:hypothetical protein
MLFNFIYLFLSVLVCCRSICGDSEKVTIKRGVENDGFHRYLVTTLIFNSSAPLRAYKYCEWLLVERLSSGVYVDRHELKTQERTLLYTISSPVSVEKPEYGASEFELFVFPNRNVMRSGAFTVRVPIHLRYHAPSTTDLSAENAIIELTAPRLFLSQCVVDTPPLGFNVRKEIFRNKIVQT